MYSQQSLMDDLANMGIARNETVLVHSSMKAIGAVDGGADTVLDALMAYFAPGLLVLPTHTWATVHPAGEMLYDISETPSCVGMLTNLFRKRPCVYRSAHPTHSVAAYGADAQDFIANEENAGSPCARAGCYGKLLDRDARILLVGCSLRQCTFFHGVEEWADVPNRVGVVIPYAVRLPDGRCVPAPTRRHVGDPSEQYGRAEEALVRGGALTYQRFGDARVLLLSAQKAAAVVTGLLKEDIDFFGENR